MSGGFFVKVYASKQSCGFFYVFLKVADGGEPYAPMVQGKGYLNGHPMVRTFIVALTTPQKV